MNNQTQQRINHLVSTVQRYFPLLIIPAIVGLVLATAYAFLLMPEMWTARQSFLIRDDVSGTAYKLGRFDSEESRKSAQETILEVARRPLVVRNVLEELGPSSSFAGSDWITDEVIEKTQGAIDISAPNGAEFGKTDAIVLTAKASSRERTRKFIELLSEEIMTQTNNIRSLRFESMESELLQAYHSAEQARDDAIDRLDDLDQRLGSDFGFLSLQGAPGTQNNNQPSGVEAIKSEILRKQDELDKAQSVYSALLKAYKNPADVAQLPSEVLVAQPALENAMSKMVDLREELHIAKGLFTDRNPQVKAIAKAIEFSQDQLYDSLKGEMAGVKANITLKRKQVARLENRIEELKARIIRLSRSRSEHLALTTQVQQLGEAANRAKTIWNETKSQAKSARTVGLITPTDVAQVSSRPDGIGKRFVALAGLLGGLLVGVGLIMLVAPPMESTPSMALNVNPNSSEQTRTSHTPQHRTVSSAIGSTSTESFQHAASAMQSAADAMRMAATNETTGQQSAPQPKQTEPAKQPQPVASQASDQKTPKPSNPMADDVVRMAYQTQSQTAFPKDARSQPVAGKTGSANTPRTKSKANPASKPNPFLANRKKAETTPPSKGKTIQAKATENVRPVDLAKSASVNNEFVRVNTLADGTSLPKSDSPAANNPQPQPQRVKVDSSSQAMAAAVTASHSANQTTRSDDTNTIVLSNESKPSEFEKSEQQRKSAGTEPFTVSATGETSQATPTVDQDLIDAIPEQIRKLSDSILNFGKNEK